MSPNTPIASLVSLHAPALAASLDQIISHSRRLMDAAQEAPSVVAAAFEGQVVVENLRGEYDRGNKMQIASEVAFPLVGQPYSAKLLTRSDASQCWELCFSGTPLVRREVTDRASWVRRPDADAHQPEDGPWAFTSHGKQALFGAGRDKTLAQFTQALAQLSEVTGQLTTHLTQPAIAQLMRSEKAARYGAAFVKRMGPGTEQQPTSAPEEDLSAAASLLSRIGGANRAPRS